MLSVHDAISLGLNFLHGVNFSKDVKNKFSSNVHPSATSGHFIMVVLFGRSNFKLSEDRVGLCLEACLGGLCGDLKVSVLRDRVFSFCVANKQVAFHIVKMRSFSCSQFKCFFHLWGHGGPNWQREFHLWKSENAKQWTLVSPSKRISQLALKALQKPMLKSIIASKNSVGKKLVFAENLCYSACKVYEGPSKGHGNLVTVPPHLIPDEGVIIPFGSFDTRPALVAESQPSQQKEVYSSSPDTPLPSSELLNYDNFESLIDDLVQDIYSCCRCLSFGHSTGDYTNDIHCRGCFHYGHIKKNCLNLKGRKKNWVPKVKPTGPDINSKPTDSSPAIMNPLSPSQTLSDASTLPPPLSPPSASPTAICPTVAVFELDPARWVPLGHQIEDGGP
jgi:hypothetical protein